MKIFSLETSQHFFCCQTYSRALKIICSIGLVLGIVSKTWKWCLWSSEWAIFPVGPCIWTLSAPLAMCLAKLRNIYHVQPCWGKYVSGGCLWGFIAPPAFCSLDFLCVGENVIGHLPAPSTMLSLPAATLSHLSSTPLFLELLLIVVVHYSNRNVTNTKLFTFFLTGERISLFRDTWTEDENGSKFWIWISQ